MWENSRKDGQMETESIFGQLEATIKDNSQMDWNMEEDISKEKEFK